ncbi:WD40/YVTN/BNR-like repeat-containing protein [Pseudomonas fluorescens]|uniref:WD40/YVTN/BNR-like repeat-containing protein n=1 Tax=Pseudomonas fluorescens TaxID=294 RepID=UPI001255C3E1|nr:YCF48-related protein [Pseudomonas fluorescens]CAG8864499.1 Ycf48-like protein [Pseudomonas fluorescens]VVM36997.1 Ycf48-like protein [Pseudomonas fluorescens]
MVSTIARAVRWLSAMYLVAAAYGASAEAERPAVLDRPAREVSQPASTFLLGVTKAGGRLVAVGESGRIVLSDDQGENWRQAKVPTSVLLTAVAFADTKVGWAIGHSGVVIRTEDGGETWSRQLDGVQVARLIYDAVSGSTMQRSGIDTGISASQAERLIEDGPDKPFLALRVEDTQKATIVGAFGYALHTVDGGKHWISLDTQLKNPIGLHYYGIEKTAEGLLFVGEQGIVQRQITGSEFLVETPSEGTLFGVLSLGNQVLIAYGLRGKVVRSQDDGKTWSKLDSGVEASIQAGVVLPDGALLLVAENGQMISSHDRGSTFNLLPTRSPPTADVLSVSANSLLVVGPLGAQTITVP